MTKAALPNLTGWLIAAYALDILVPVIDIFGLPLPRYVASMSFSSCFLLAALAFLVPLAWRQRVPLLGPAELSLAGVLAFWFGLEAIAGLRQDRADFALVLDFLPLLLVVAASRLHLELFEAPGRLVSAFVLAAAALVSAHTVLLLAVSLQVPVPMVNVGELRGRNAMAQLVPMSLWLLAFFPLRGWPVLGWRYNLLLALGLVNMWLTSSRSALPIEAWCVMTGIALAFPYLRRLQFASLLPAGLAIVAVTAFAYPIAMALGGDLIQLAGGGDDATSIWSRSRTNFMLIDKLWEDPVLGIGWAEVAATKAYGYMGHTLYINALSAYGWIGALPVIVLACLWLSALRGKAREPASHLLFLMLLIGSVFNNVFAWFGIPLALIEAARLQHAPRLHEHVSKTPQLA